MVDGGVYRSTEPEKRDEGGRVTLAQILEGGGERFVEGDSGKVKEPVIFEEKGYLQKIKEFDPGVGRIPHDFIRFDATELEGTLREILHANDHWSYLHPAQGKEWASTHQETEEEEDIRAMVEQKNTQGNRSSLAQNRMSTSMGPLADRYDEVTNCIMEEGPIYLT